jgi:hypothetical protein
LGTLGEPCDRHQWDVGAGARFLLCREALQFRHNQLHGKPPPETQGDVRAWLTNNTALQNQAMSVNLHGRNEAAAQIVDGLERDESRSHGGCARCDKPIPHTPLLGFRSGSVRLRLPRELTVC